MSPEENKVRISEEKQDSSHSHDGNLRFIKRSKHNSMIAGVCAGIAEYLEVDPTVIRILFVVFTFIGGSGVIVYILLWLLMPEESSERLLPKERMNAAVSEMREKASTFVRYSGESSSDSRSSQLIPALLVFGGLFFLLRSYGFHFGSHDFWPLIIILIGVALIYKRQ